MLINDEFFQMLSKTDQAIIKKAARVAGTMGRAIQQFNTVEGVTKVSKEGMKVHSPTAQEMAEFKKLAQPAVREWLAKELGKEAEWIKKLDAAVAEALKKSLNFAVYAPGQPDASLPLIWVPRSAVYTDGPRTAGCSRLHSERTEALQGRGLQGGNVTHPYKRDAL